jgi:hypothetical protein
MIGQCAWNELQEGLGRAIERHTQECLAGRVSSLAEILALAAVWEQQCSSVRCAWYGCLCLERWCLSLVYITTAVAGGHYAAHLVVFG